MRNVKKNDLAAELWPGVSIELLKALHILTRDGDLNADSRRKLKQVQHLVRLLTPAVEDILGRFPEPSLVDCGAGKGYLGFLLAQTALPRGKVVGLETRPELVRSATEIAKKAGLADRVTFVAGAVDAYVATGRVHMVTALHACDTATDDALFFALSQKADHVALVPCCQAEVAAQLKARAGDPTLLPLYDHALHRREFGSHLTNTIRALLLRAQGYEVTVTELVGLEHSMKNELILARRVHREHAPSQAALTALLERFGVEPKIVRMLRGTEGSPQAPSAPEALDAQPSG